MSIWANSLVRPDTTNGVSDIGTIINGKVANIKQGGQLGAGAQYTRLDAATPLIYVPAIVLVTHLPTIFDNNDQYRGMLKALVETHAKSIDGIDISYTIGTEGSIVGHDQQEVRVPTRTTREIVNPQMTFQELTGNPVWNIFYKWIISMNHPDTNASLMAAIIDNDQALPFIVSSFSMSILVIQPDPTGIPDNIIEALHIVNMFPTTTTEQGIKRVLGTYEAKERNIPFTGIVQHNDNIRALGKNVMEVIQYHKLNYQFANVGTTPADIKNLGNVGGATNEINRMLKDFKANNYEDSYS